MKYLLLLIFTYVFVSCDSPINKTLIHVNSESEAILFKSVNIFNGRDSSLLMNKDVLINDGIVKLIQDEILTSNIDSNLTIINGEGKTLIPGFIDAHVHVSGSGAVPWSNVKPDPEYNLKAYLYAGITTVYDLGGLAKTVSNISKKVNNGEVVGPAIYNTHIPITVKNSHPIPLTEQMLSWPLNKMVNGLSVTIDSPDEAGEVIKNYIKKDIDYVKIICDQIPPGSPEMSD